MVLNTVELNFQNLEDETLTNTTLPLTSSEWPSVGFEALSALPPLSLFGGGYADIEWSRATWLHGEPRHVIARCRYNKAEALVSLFIFITSIIAHEKGQC